MRGLTRFLSPGGTTEVINFVFAFSPFSVVPTRLKSEGNGNLQPSSELLGYYQKSLQDIKRSAMTESLTLPEKEFFNGILRISYVQAGSSSADGFGGRLMITYRQGTTK